MSKSTQNVVMTNSTYLIFYFSVCFIYCLVFSIFLNMYTFLNSNSTLKKIINSTEQHQNPMSCYYYVHVLCLSLSTSDFYDQMCQFYF